MRKVVALLSLTVVILGLAPGLRAAPGPYDSADSTGSASGGATHDEEAEPSGLLSVHASARYEDRTGIGYSDAWVTRRFPVDADRVVVSVTFELVSTVTASDDADSFIQPLLGVRSLDCDGSTCTQVGTYLKTPVTPMCSDACLRPEAGHYPTTATVTLPAGTNVVEVDGRVRAQARALATDAEATSIGRVIVSDITLS